MVDACNIHITFGHADSGRTRQDYESQELVIEGVPQLMAHSSMKVKRLLYLQYHTSNYPQ